MMSRKKVAGFSRDAALYGAGNALGRVVGLVMLPILTRVFDTGDYGAIALLSVSYTFTLTAMRLGVPSGMQRFYFRAEGIDRRALVGSCGAFLIATAVVLSAVIALFSSQVSRRFGPDDAALRWGVMVLGFCLPLDTIWDYGLLLLRLQRRAILFSAFNVIRVILTPSLTYMFVVTYGHGIEGVFYARWISVSTLAAGLVVATRAEWSTRLRWSTVKRVLRFALPGHPGLIIRTSMNVLPQYMLAAVAPLSAVGLYGIAFRLSNLLKILGSSFSLAWNPFAYQNEGAHDEARLYELAFKGFFGFMVALGFAMAVLAGDALRVLSTPQFYPASLLVPGLALHFLADGLTVILSTILYTRDHVKWATHLSLVRIACFVALALPLLPRYGAAGLVIAISASSVIYFLGYVWRTRSSFPFRIPWGSMVVVLLVAGALIWALAQWTLPPVQSVLLNLLVAVCFGGALPAVLLTSNERQALREIVTSARERVASVAS